jgi:hypothetical protein
MIDTRDHTYVSRLTILMIGFKRVWSIQHPGTCKLTSVSTRDELMIRSMLQSEVSCCKR